MDALEYLKIKSEICKTQTTCEGCYLGDCLENESDNPQKAIELVQKWKEENAKTPLNQLRKTLHDAGDCVIDEIANLFCPWTVFPNLIKPHECISDCKICWSREMTKENE